VPNLTAKAGEGLSEGLSPSRPFFETLIQQRDVTEPVNKASIIWRDSQDPKSHMTIKPELSGNNG
jgi:hypothetical protein